MAHESKKKFESVNSCSVIVIRTLITKYVGLTLRWNRSIRLANLQMI